MGRVFNLLSGIKRICDMKTHFNKRKIYPRKCRYCKYKWEARIKNPRQCPNCKRQIKYDKIPDKEIAREVARHAIDTGKLMKKPCEVCGKKKVHAHHTDYRKPLKIMWLCPKHHFAWHKKNGSPFGK